MPSISRATTPVSVTEFSPAEKLNLTMAVVQRNLTSTRGARS